ncbi:MAG: lipid-A-disaccharide synthase, partial [Natronospirillum sp.]
EGFSAWADQERLAVMGLFEVVRRLPELLRLRAELKRRILDWQPDVFIGIDAPDFNLPLARKLRGAGLTTAHYVSPSVWAWRQGRVKGIRESVDLMLTLFPFEGEFYAAHGVPHVCVGHTLADHLPLATATAEYRATLGLSVPAGTLVLALLPGSRNNEVRYLTPDFLAAARLVKARLPTLQVLIPAASTARRHQIEAFLQSTDQGWITVLDGQSHEVLGSADAALLASGTAALEAALLKKPMVVGYRFSALTYWLGKWLIKTPWVSLPNILTRRMVVPELIQYALTPERAAAAIEQMLTDPVRRADCEQTFTELHHLLRRDADEVAASAVLDLLTKATRTMPSHAVR